MGDVKNYDASKVSVIFGTRAIKGFAEDSMVSIARDEQSFVKKIGADGEVTRSKTNNRAGMITITLDQASESNDYLSESLVADEKTGNSIKPVLVRDASGRTIAASDKSWVQGWPEAGMARDSGDREWIIDVGDLENFIGGNG